MPTSIFERAFDRQADQPLASPTAYNLILGGVLFWGFGLNWFIVKYFPRSWLTQVDPTAVLLVFAALCGLGFLCYTKSQNALLSFVGYNLVVLPFGLVVDYFVSSSAPALVLHAALSASIVTVLMMLLSVLFPDFFARLEGSLVVSLGAAVLFLAGGAVLGGSSRLMDWLVTLLLCFYIGYDWAHANRLPKTVNNAVDSAAKLYMDVIILFLKILTSGRKRKR